MLQTEKEALKYRQRSIHPNHIYTENANTLKMEHLLNNHATCNTGELINLANIVIINVLKNFNKQNNNTSHQSN